MKVKGKEQEMINETLCSENCVARYVWKHGELDPKVGNAVKWDQEVVNTCPDNFSASSGTLLISAEGMYEISAGFFARKKKAYV